MTKNQHNKIALFESKQIRKIWHEDQWYFSVIDVCRALTESPDAGAYWRKLKQRLNSQQLNPDLIEVKELSLSLVHLENDLTKFMNENQCLSGLALNLDQSTNSTELSVIFITPHDKNKMVRHYGGTPDLSVDWSINYAFDFARRLIKY